MFKDFLEKVRFGCTICFQLVCCRCLLKGESGAARVEIQSANDWRNEVP